MKNLGVYFAIFIIVGSLINNAVAAEESDFLQLNGKSLFSFTEKHFIVQTDKYFYKITKEGLAKDTQNKLEKATINNENDSYTIPRKNIGYIWPAEFLGTSCCWSGKSEDDYSATTAELFKEVSENNGRVRVKGSLVLSFSDPYYLVQVNETIYQLKKSALTKEQLKDFENINIGGHINIAVPQSAVNYSWSFRKSAKRGIASIEEPDSVSLNNSFMTLKGIILYSADEPMVIVQSSNMIYHLKRNGIITNNSKLLDINGSKIQLRVPVKDIEFFWSTANEKLVNMH